MKEFRKGLALLFCCVWMHAAAEISWVKVSWNAPTCGAACHPVLEKRLNGIDSVSRVAFNFPNGTAQLYWKPNYPYDDRAIRTAVAWVGLGLRDVRMKLRGTISHDAKDVYIHSLGDDTKMPLLSAPRPDKSRYVVKGSLSAISLDSDVKDRLLEAEKNHEVVTIEGLVFMPYRPPIHLQIEDIKYGSGD